MRHQLNRRNIIAAVNDNTDTVKVAFDFGVYTVHRNGDVQSHSWNGDKLRKSKLGFYSPKSVQARKAAHKRGFVLTGWGAR